MCKFLVVICWALWFADCSGACHWDYLHFQYAKMFKLARRGDNFKFISNKSTVYFYHKVKPRCGEGIYLQYPVKRIATLSTTYLGFLERLGMLQSVKLISNQHYVSSPFILQQLKSGNVHDVGYPPRAELLLKYHPDVILDFPPVGTPANYMSSIQQHIPIIFIREYAETHPLARAEWIKFFGLLTGKYKLANTVFAKISQRYHKIIQKIKTPYQHKVLIGKLYNGIWNAPSPQSYLVQFLQDLKIPYIFQHKSGKRLLISWEEVLQYKEQIAFWLPQFGWKEKSAVLAENEQYKLLGQRILDHIYPNSKRLKGSANDYWESGVAYPERVLADLATIAYPTIFPSNPLYFYIRL